MGMSTWIFDLMDAAEEGAKQKAMEYAINKGLTKDRAIGFVEDCWIDFIPENRRNLFND